MIPWSSVHRTLALGLVGAVAAATVLVGPATQSDPFDASPVSVEGEDSTLQEQDVPLVDDADADADEPTPETLRQAPEETPDADEESGQGGGDPDAPVAELERTTTDPFNMVGVTWEGGADLRVEVSYRTGGSWSAFEDLEVEAVDPTEGGRAGTEPLWINEGADGVSVKITSASGALPRDVKVATIDPGEDGLVAPTAGAPGQPPIIMRSSWGAKSASCSTGNPATRGATIHHTAGNNSYSQAQVAGILRSYQDYHRSRGWCDIGYNFLVDRFGRIFEGRVGGITNMVRGAHAGTNGANTYTVGIAMMGTFTSVAPSAATREAVADLVAWRFGRAGLPARGTHTLDGRSQQRIIGHRDVKATECPGAAGYAWVTRTGTGLRDSVAARLANSATGAPVPSGLQVQGTGPNSLALSWNAVSGATRYQVQVSQSSSMSSPATREYTTTSGAVTGLNPSQSPQRYYVRVRVLDAGGRSSAWSPVVSALTTAANQASGVSVRGAGPDALAVSFRGVAGASGYEVQVSQSSSMSSPATRVFSGASGTVSGLNPAQPAQRYYVRVRTAGGSPGPWSPVASGTTSVPLPAPSGVSVSAAGERGLAVSWNRVPGAQRYRVQVSRSSSMSSPATREFTSTSGSVTGLNVTSPPQLYYVRVQVIDRDSGATVGAWSAPVQGRTAAGNGSTPPAASTNTWTAGSATSVTLKGRGFGHGIGMSQYGAYGGAARGASVRAILSTYYPGTTIVTRGSPIRVLVGADTDGNTTILAKSGLRFQQGSRNISLPTSVDGRAVSQWRIEPLASDRRQSTLRYLAGGTWRTYQSLTWTGHADFTASAMNLVLPGGRTVAYRTRLRAARASSTATTVRTVNLVNLDDYVRGVVPREVPATWPREAVRAQSIAARTYGLRSVSSGGWYDICDTTACQVYGGMSAEHSATNTAVSTTSNMVLDHQGSTAFTQFSSSSGGFTNQGSQPYLRPVADPWDDNTANPNHTWTQAVSVATIRARYPSVGAVRSMSVVQRNGHGALGGRVQQLRIVGSSGTVTVSGPAARSAFGLKSDWFGF